MQSGKKRPFDVDAWVQFHLLRTAAFHPETTKADVAVLAEIIQRYHGQYGNGWASHEHLAAMTGVSLPTVKRAKKTLERLGFVTVLAGGRRGSATVYLPNFALVARKGITDDTESFGVKDDTEMVSKGISDDTETPQKGIKDDPPSYLPDRPTRAESQIDRDDCAAPLAPPAVGLVATTAGPAQGGFEELRLSYYPDGKSRNIADERRAYSSLDPDAHLHAEMVEAARTWHAAWAAQADINRPRFSLSRWIREEHYRNAPPTGFKPKERKANRKDRPAKQTATAEPAADNDNKPTFEWMRGSPRLWPAGRYVGEFIAGDIDRSSGDEEVTLSFRVTSPGEHEDEVFQHRFYTSAFIKSYQDEGQRVLAGICLAVGVADIEDTDELLHKPIKAIADGRHVAYLPLPAEEAA